MRPGRSRPASEARRGVPPGAAGSSRAEAALRGCAGRRVRPSGSRRTRSGRGLRACEGSPGTSGFRGRSCLSDRPRGTAIPNGDGGRGTTRLRPWADRRARSRQTVRRLRPRSRRRFRTARPPRVLMRSRKPWTFFRRRLWGWNVRFTLDHLECESRVRSLVRVGESKRRRPFGQYERHRSETRVANYFVAPFHRRSYIPTPRRTSNVITPVARGVCFTSRPARFARCPTKVEMPSTHALPDIAFSGRNGITRNPLRPCYFVDKCVDCAWSGCVHLGAGT